MNNLNKQTLFGFDTIKICVIACGGNIGLYIGKSLPDGFCNLICIFFNKRF